MIKLRNNFYFYFFLKRIRLFLYWFVIKVFETVKYDNIKNSDSNYVIRFMIAI